MSGTTDFILLLALGLAGLIFWRLHQARIQAPGAAAAEPGATGTAPAPTLALGQWAVDPARQWLLIQPGQ
jgi:hypothetical protein